MMNPSDLLGGARDEHRDSPLWSIGLRRLIMTAAAGGTLAWFRGLTDVGSMSHFGDSLAIDGSTVVLLGSSSAYVFALRTSSR